MNNNVFKREYNYGDFNDIIDIYKIYDKSIMEERKIFGNAYKTFP